MGMRFVSTNRKLRDLHKLLSPLIWHTESEHFSEFCFKPHPDRSNTIIGYLPEDGTSYEITCPSKLRPALITGLNLLKHIYIT